MNDFDDSKIRMKRQLIVCKALKVVCKSGVNYLYCRDVTQQIMKRYSKLLFLFFAIFPFTLAAQTVEELFQGKVAADLLIKDLKEIVASLENKHPNLYQYIDKKTFTKKIDSLKGTISTPLTRLEFRYKVLTVLQHVGDGHMTLTVNAPNIPQQTFDKYFASRVFPVNQFMFIVVGNKLYNRGSWFNEEIPKGSEILSINGLSSSEVISKMNDGLCADGYNPSLKFYTLNAGLFPSIYTNTFGYQDTLTFKIQLPNEVKTVKVHTITSGLKPVTVAKIPESSRGTEQDKTYGTLTIGSFDNAHQANYQQWFTEFKTAGIKTLVIDLRNNLGGEQANVTRLFSYLIKQPSFFAYIPKNMLNTSDKANSESIKTGVVKKIEPSTSAFDGKIYLLINGGSFSATAILAANLQAIKADVTIVGTESGGGSDGCTGGTFKSVFTTHSNLLLRFGEVPLKTLSKNKEKGRGVIPNVGINYNLDDYMAKRDLEMDWIKNNVNK